MEKLIGVISITTSIYVSCQYTRFYRCTCDNCQILDKAIENICCQEIQEIRQKNMELAGTSDFQSAAKCIVLHPGFKAVCLNKWVLETAWFQYKQQYEEPFEGPEHKKNRHIAYRQLARWCWGFLGRQVRVVLPSCAVSCIRAHFPPPGNEDDFVFAGFSDPAS